MPKNIFVMKHFLLIISTLLLFSACKETADSVFNGPYQRTVIVYMSGENDLDRYTTNDLDEMISGSTSVAENEKLIVFVDKSDAQRPPYILDMHNGIADTLKIFDSDFYASDPKMFAGVIDYVEKKFPSEEYGLVLWGHATGWLVSKDTIATTADAASRPFRAYGCDRGYNVDYGLGERWMNITQMARALEGMPKLKFIFADCCSMMCAESAYELRNVTDFLIGSPAEIPGAGAPYHLIVKDLFNRSDDFYKKVVDDYYDYYLDYYRSSEFNMGVSDNYLNGYSVPLSVVDMRYIGELADATRSILKHQDSISIDSVVYYLSYDVPVLHEMGNIVERNFGVDEVEVWRQALAKVVPYKRFSARWMSIYSDVKKIMLNSDYRYTEDNYSGLSMFVPKPVYNYSRYFLYNEGLKQMGWYKAVGWDRFF